MREKRKKKKGYPLGCLVFTLCIITLIGLGLYFLLTNPFVLQTYSIYTGTLSPKVIENRALLEEAAAKYGIQEYVPQLLAIMEVESGGENEDIMQASESLGLAANSLTKENSIDRGTAYFAELVSIGRSLGVDLNTVIQSYNYGPDFLYYVYNNGGMYTFELAQAYAQEHASNRQVKYYNIISVMENGGWRYDYGNMFYTRLVNRYIPE